VTDAEYQLSAEIVAELAPGFSRDVQTKISAALKDVTAAVRIGADLTPGFSREVQDKMKAALASVSASVHVTADTKAAKLEIEKLAAGKHTAAITLKLDRKQFDADLAYASAQLDKLTARARISGGGGGGAGGGGGGFIGGGGGGYRGGGGGSGGGATHDDAGNILAGVLPGGRRAGPGAIIGAVALGAGPIAGTALAAIPVALATIGAFAEHANASVSASFSGMTTAAEQTLARGFQPLVPALVSISDQAKSTVAGLEPTFERAATAVSPLLKTITTGFTSAAAQGVTDFTGQLDRLGPVAGGLGGLFIQLEHGVNGLFSNLNVSAAAEGLHQISSLVQTLLPEVGSLVSSVAPLANSALALANALLSGLAPALRGVADLMNIPGIAPLVLAFGGLAVASRVLTGSWTALKALAGDAGWSKMAAAFNLNTRATLESKSALAANSNELLGYKAQIAEVNAELASNRVLTAETAIENDASLVNVRALAQAKIAEIATDDALAIANAEVAATETAAASAAKGFWASIGLVGWAILGVTAIATAIGFAGGNAITASTAAATLTTQIDQLAQAGGSSAASFAANNDQYKELVKNATAAKIPLQDVFAAIDKGSSGLAELTANTQKTLDELGAKQSGTTITHGGGRFAAQQQTLTVDQLTEAVNRQDIAYSGLNKTSKDQVDKQNALHDALKGQTQATKDAHDAEVIRAAAVVVNTTLTQGSAQALAETNRQLLRTGDYATTVTKSQKSYNDMINSGLGGTAAYIDNLQSLNAATYTTQARTAEAAYSTGTLNVMQQAEAIVADKVTNANGQLATSLSVVARNTEQVAIDTAAANSTYAGLQSGMSQTAALAEGLAAAQEKVNSDFAAASAPIENQIKNTIAYNSALANATQTQDTIASQAQAITDAQDALNQAQAPGTGLVAQALYNQAQAQQGLVSAVHSQAMGDIAAGLAQKNLTLARRDAIQTLKDLSLQTKDQADTEANAKLKLIDAQNAVNALGLQNTQLKISDINLTGGVTYANEVQLKAILALDEARNSYNDTVNNGAKLAVTSATATAQGVDQAPTVVAAQQAVNDALYNQAQQQLAVKAAQHGILMQTPDLHNAYKQLHADSVAVKTAQDSQTSATDLTTTSIVGLFDAWVKNHDNTPIIESDFVNVAQKAYGVHAGVKAIADRLFGVSGELPGVNGAAVGFSIVGTPSLNLNSLIQQAQAMGIDPHGLGFSGQQILASKTPGSFGNIPGPIGSSLAVGGPVPGWSPNQTADNIPIMATAGEHMWTAEEVQKAGGHGAVSQLRKAVRGYANGGAIQTANNIIRGAANDPYVWGAVGPNAFDCSGLVGDVYAALKGLPLNKRYMVTQSNFAALGFRPGHGAFTIGVNPATHMAGNLAGLGFEARSTKAGIKIGAAAQSVDAFQQQWYLPDIGGAFTDAGGGGFSPGGAYTAGGAGTGTSAADARRIMGYNIKLATMAAAGQGISSSLAAFGIHPKSKLTFNAAARGAGRAPATPIDFGAFRPGGDPGTTAGGLSTVSGDRAANKAIMQSVFSKYGWGSGPMWAAQDYLEMREAGYNNTAQNPTSTAYGMGQFLNSTWAGYGPKTADSRLQSEYMAQYEGRRYGDPIRAAAHEKQFNWYDLGGDWKSGTMGINTSGKTEAVLTGPERDAYQAQARAAAANKPVRLDDYTIARLAQALSLANNDRPVNVKVSSQGSGVFIPS
jgi:hypothetical protein